MAYYVRITDPAGAVSYLGPGYISVQSLGEAMQWRSEHDALDYVQLMHDTDAGLRLCCEVIRK